MRNTTVTKSIDKNAHSEKRRVSYLGLANFHTLSKVSSYEQKIVSGKIALKNISKQILKLEKSIIASTSTVNSEVQEQQLPTFSLGVLGVSLNINPSLKSLANDPFIVEKTERANLKFSKNR